MKNVTLISDKKLDDDFKLSNESEYIKIYKSSKMYLDIINAIAKKFHTSLDSFISNVNLEEQWAEYTLQHPDGFKLIVEIDWN